MMPRVFDRVAERAFVLLGMLILLQSCITIHQGAKPGTAEDEVVTTSVPKDTVYVVEDGSVEIVAGVERPSSSGRLSRIGDRVRINDNEQIRLSFQGFDPKQHVLVSEYDQQAQATTMYVVERAKLVITFTEKCQVFRVGNVSTLPRVEIAPSLTAEQIIVTPMCDGNKTIVGYEYRYGSQESGCRKEAGPGMKEWKRCKEATRGAKSRGGKTSPDNVVATYFGI